MPNRRTRLKSLMSLAREPSSDKRGELLREIVDLFVEYPTSYSIAETEHMGGIMAQIASKMEMRVRERLANRMSELLEAPKNLIVQFANDDIGVAKPILEKSDVLDNVELLNIVKSRSQEYLLAISTRKTVSEEVADGLVERGNDEVLLALVKNNGAELSRPSQQKIVARARNNEALRAPLADRTDLDGNTVEAIFDMVSDALKDRVMANSADMRGAETFTENRMTMAGLDETFLMRLLEKEQVDEFIVGFAKISEISTRAAQRIIFETDGEALAVACKAGNFSKETFNNVLVMSRREARKRHGAEGDESKIELLDFYDQIPLMSAKRAIRFWNARERAKQYSDNQIK